MKGTVLSILLTTECINYSMRNDFVTKFHSCLPTSNFYWTAVLNYIERSGVSRLHLSLHDNVYKQWINARLTYKWGIHTHFPIWIHFNNVYLNSQLFFKQFNYLSIFIHGFQHKDTIGEGSSRCR